MYIDRITGFKNSNKLICPKCNRLLGIRIIYEKENRPAYRLFVGAVSKKIVKAEKV